MKNHCLMVCQLWRWFAMIILSRIDKKDRYESVLAKLLHLSRMESLLMILNCLVITALQISNNLKLFL
jgi:hypothetical protein